MHTASEKKKKKQYFQFNSGSNYTIGMKVSIPFNMLGLSLKKKYKYLELNYSLIIDLTFLII